MCFSPQRRAIFRQQNVKKCSEAVSFLTFWLPNVLFATAPGNFSTAEHQKEDYSFWTFSLPNVLFATAACNFSTAELQKVLRSRQFFNILTFKCAFRHSARQFFDSRTSKSAPKTTVFLTFWLSNVRFATAPGNFSTVERQKVLRRLHVFNILTFKCAFRHSGMQFFDIWTDKSGPNMRCFVHFDFQMCFSPQRHAIFRHLNRQKWSKHAVFCTFWLPNVLFATAACNFWCHLSAPTSAPAALTGLLLDWPDTRIYEKTQHFVTSSVDWLDYSTTAFQLSILSEVSI